MTLAKNTEIRLVLFDLDGVLVDACELHYEALNRALKEIAEYEISRKDHEETFNALTTRQKLAILVERGVVSEDRCDAVWLKKQKLTIDVVKDLVKPDQGKIALHQWLLSKGCRIGCVTNSVKASARLMLELSGQLEYMSIVVSNTDVVNPKPHSEGYIKAMIALQTFPENTMIVEDSEKGIQAAQGTGALVLKVPSADYVTINTIQSALQKVGA